MRSTISYSFSRSTFASFPVWTPQGTFVTMASNDPSSSCDRIALASHLMKRQSAAAPSASAFARAPSTAPSETSIPTASIGTRSPFRSPFTSADHSSSTVPEPQNMSSSRAPGRGSRRAALRSMQAARFDLSVTRLTYL